MTDSGSDVRFDVDEKPGISNLLTIYSSLTGRSIVDLEEEYAGRGYGDLKKGLVEVVAATFDPIRARTAELLADPAELDRVLSRAADRASETAEKTLATVYDRIGFLRRTR